MKRFLLLVLCALFAIHSAEARTLYVNAKRPNNKGNGRSLKAAKKTIQAAINIAKNGDTILVYPGTYAPIKTNNKKITIKRVKGKSKTTIKNNTEGDITIALLGKTWATGGYVDTNGRKLPKGNSAPYSEGNATTLAGVVLNGGYMDSAGLQIGVSGGAVLSSTIKGLGSKSGAVAYGMAAHRANLTFCLITDNRSYIDTIGLLSYATLKQCTVKGNAGEGGIAWCSTFVNSLVVQNTFTTGWYDSSLSSSTFINCTIADNISKYSLAPINFAEGSKFYNCILRNNKRTKSSWGYVDKVVTETGYYDEWDDWYTGDPNGSGYYDDNSTFVPYKMTTRTYTDSVYAETLGTATVHNVDKGNTYKNTDKTNKNPKFVNAAKGNYKLKKGSYCINKGKLTKAQKKLVGTKDLDGKKRIKGKAIDIGCYEY